MEQVWVQCTRTLNSTLTHANLKKKKNTLTHAIYIYIYSFALQHYYYYYYYFNLIGIIRLVQI